MDDGLWTGTEIGGMCIGAGNEAGAMAGSDAIGIGVGGITIGVGVRKETGFSIGARVISPIPPPPHPPQFNADDTNKTQNCSHVSLPTTPSC